jgi:hypothetical protein
MKFYNREEEIKSLNKITNNSRKIGAQLTILVGRRRIGKSELIHQAFKSKKYLYFFVSRKKSANLLREFSDLLNQKQKDDRVYQSWDEFLPKLFKWAIKTKTTLVFDEFQDFSRIDGDIFSLFQKYWDKLQHEKNLNVIVAGSIISLLEKIFYNQKEPLFNRATNKIHLQEFDYSTVKKILTDHRKKKINILELLGFQVVFGGGPYYYQELYKTDLFKKDLNKIIDALLLKKDATLQKEGRELLILELGKEHAPYFSILESIALNYNTFLKIHHHTKIEQSVLVRNLKRLTKQFHLIKKQKPVFPNNQKTSRYRIANNFLFFWFRYLYPYQSLIESGFIKSIQQKIKTDFKSLIGLEFEKFCLNYLMNLSEKTKLEFIADKFGQWWDKKGEIDLIVASTQEKKAILGECKLNPKEITPKLLEKLKSTSEKINTLKDYQKKFILFCAQKVPATTKKKITQSGGEVWDGFRDLS